MTFLCDLNGTVVDIYLRAFAVVILAWIIVCVVAVWRKLRKP